MAATREIPYDADGLRMTGLLAVPDGDGPWPAVLIAHDGVGLDHYQSRRAELIAEHGYAAFAMDYHGGRSFYGDHEGLLARTLPLLADLARFVAIGRTALELLLAVPGVDPDRLGALGYGAGANLVLELARTGVPFRGVAAIHPGASTLPGDGWAALDGAILLATGSEDPICTPDQLLAFAGVLQEAGVDWRAEIHGGAEHAFWAPPHDADGSATSGTRTGSTPPGSSRHPAATARTWRSVLELLDDTVGPAPSCRLS